MASMLWIRPIAGRELEGTFPANYQVYKRFDDKDFGAFLECLKNPEKPRPSVAKDASDIGLTSMLYLSFLDGSSYIVFFSLEDETAILQNGYSQKLFSLFTAKEQGSGYAPEKDPTVPLKEPGAMMQHEVLQKI